MYTITYMTNFHDSLYFTEEWTDECGLFSVIVKPGNNQNDSVSMNRLCDLSIVISSTLNRSPTHRLVYSYWLILPSVVRISNNCFLRSNQQKLNAIHLLHVSPSAAKI